MSITIQNMYTLNASPSSQSCSEAAVFNADGSVNYSFSTITPYGNVGALVPVAPNFDLRSYTIADGTHYTTSCNTMTYPSTYPVTGNPVFNEGQGFTMLFYDPSADDYKSVTLTMLDRGDMPAFYRASDSDTWTSLGSSKALMKEPSSLGWSYAASKLASVKDLYFSGNVNKWACPLQEVSFVRYPETNQEQFRGYTPASPFATNVDFNSAGSGAVSELYPSISNIRQDSSGRWYARLGLGVMRWTCGLWNGMPYAGPNSTQDYYRTYLFGNGYSGEGSYDMLDDSWAPFGSWNVLLNTSVATNTSWYQGNFGISKSTNVVIGS